MKTYLIIAGLVVILSGAVVSTASAAPIINVNAGLSGVIQKVAAKLELVIAKLNNDLQAQVVHVTLKDQACQTAATSGTVIGWCPDGERSSFSISDSHFKAMESVVTAQVTNPTDPDIMKITNCAYRAVTGATSATPLIRLSCETAPLDGATLNYVIINQN